MKRFNREIGSEFWDVPVCDNFNTLFPENTKWYLSGRSALMAIIKDIKKRTHFYSVALPSWCCASMILPFLLENIDVKFYSVFFEDGELKYDFSNVHNCDAILIMDYFGYIRKIEHWFKGIVINDITHSVFCPNIYNADYTFGSLRKWAGFFTGGFAYTKDNRPLEINQNPGDAEYISLRQLAMDKKSAFINGKTDSKQYLSDFLLAESILDEYLCGEADSFDVLRAKKMDISLIKLRRRENATVLLKSLSQFAMFPQFVEDDCPLFVPLLIPDGRRDALRKHLIEKNIYCPVHWPVSEVHQLDSKTRKLYEQEISIVCDQRYNVLDMEYICAEIKEFLGCDK